jgi:hypothetical protein
VSRFTTKSTLQLEFGAGIQAVSGTIPNPFNVGIGTTTPSTYSAILAVAGNISPTANNSYNLGSSSYRWANLYTGDLHLSNAGHEDGNIVDGTKGDWTIQEGEENLYIINNKSGKKYKFALSEV